MIKLKSIEIAGGICPYQLEGTTDDGQYFYLRYRYGTISYKVYSGRRYSSSWSYDFVKKIGDDLDGAINSELAMETLKGLVEFPEGFTFDQRVEPPYEDESELP